MKFNPKKMSINELNDRALILAKIQIAIWVAAVIASALLMFSPSAKADCDEIYLKVGAGYKFDEQKEIRLQQDSGKVYEIANSPYSARFETGVECGNLTYGISHHSQWATGIPFNDTGEYYKTEFFIDYKFSWGI